MHIKVKKRKVKGVSQSGQWFVTTDLKRQFVFLYVVKLKPQKLEEVLLYSSC